MMIKKTWHYSLCQITVSEIKKQKIILSEYKRNPAFHVVAVGIVAWFLCKKFNHFHQHLLEALFMTFLFLLCQSLNGCLYRWIKSVRHGMKHNTCCKWCYKHMTWISIKAKFVFVCYMPQKLGLEGHFQGLGV